MSTNLTATNVVADTVVAMSTYCNCRRWTNFFMPEESDVMSLPLRELLLRL